MPDGFAPVAEATLARSSSASGAWMPTVSTPQRITRVDPEEKAAAVTSREPKRLVAGPSLLTTPAIGKPRGGSTRHAAAPARKTSLFPLMAYRSEYRARFHFRLTHIYVSCKFLQHIIDRARDPLCLPWTLTPQHIPLKRTAGAKRAKPLKTHEGSRDLHCRHGNRAGPGWRVCSPRTGKIPWPAVRHDRGNYGRGRMDA